jgi:hypothetical protein
MLGMEDVRQWDNEKGKDAFLCHEVSGIDSR